MKECQNAWKIFHQVSTVGISWTFNKVTSLIDALIDVITTLLGRHLALLKAQFVLQSQAVVFTMHSATITDNLIESFSMILLRIYFVSSNEYLPKFWHFKRIWQLPFITEMISGLRFKAISKQARIRCKVARQE